MLTKSFNEEKLFESIYNESNLKRLNECGGSDGHITQSGCGGSYSDEIDGYCKIGSIVEISYNAGCGVRNTTHGRLIGYY